MAQVKIVPSMIRNMEDGLRPVVRVIAHPPGTHPEKCPLVKTCTAVQVVNDRGNSRWYGVEKAWIGSDLRFRISGFSPKFEELQKWEDGQED